MRHRLLEPLNLYLTAVSLGGVGLLVALCVLDGRAALADANAEVWLLLAAVVLAELFPMRMLHRGNTGEITSSTAFAVALIVFSGPAAAVVAQVAASVVADVVQRKRWDRIVFNAGQYALAVGAAGGVAAALADVPAPAGPYAFAPADLPGILLGSGVFFVLNAALIAGVMALAEGVPFWPFLRRDLTLQISTVGMLLALSPIVVLVYDFSLALVPLLLLPLFAIHRAGQQAVVNEHQALHDSLTGLPNRVLLHDRLDQAVRLASIENGCAAVMLLDLDRFKEINDTLGHASGDLLLREVADRLTAALGPGDTVSRLGGDEFAIVLPRAGSERSAGRVAKRLREAVERPFDLAGMDLQVGASIGIACHPRDGDDAETLIQRADVAMYLAKESGSGQELYSPEQDQNTRVRLELATDLRRALERDEFRLHYQPKVATASGDVSGVEALIRWQHPDRGLLAPAEFVPLAEQTGLILPMTSWVLDAALAQVRDWRARDVDLEVAVNLPARSFLDDGLDEEIARLLERHRVAPGRLQLEITETMLMANPERVYDLLARLRAMSVGLALDDFGTGYSSLAYLKRLPVDDIKIDRAFIAGMASEPRDAAIVRSTIALAHDLDLRVVAEGVETASTLESLELLRCDFVQGYLLSRPLPAHMLERWLQGANAAHEPEPPRLVLPPGVATAA